MPVSTEEETTPGQNPIICMRQVRKSYGDLTVLKNLNLEVGHSEKIALIGPNGSGKSTILRILMTLERNMSITLRHFGE